MHIIFHVTIDVVYMIVIYQTKLSYYTIAVLLFFTQKQGYISHFYDNIHVCEFTIDNTVEPL